jgi:hypothetical protein
MFSPSLVSMMLHSIWSDLEEEQEPIQYTDYNAVAQALRNLSSRCAYTQ